MSAQLAKACIVYIGYDIFSKLPCEVVRNALHSFYVWCAVVLNRQMITEIYGDLRRRKVAVDTYKVF